MPSALPHDVPERSERTHATFAGFGRARRDGIVRRPHRFSSTLCLSPLSAFSIRRKNPRDWRRRRLGTPGCSAPSSLTRRFITARPFFSFSLSALHLKLSPELRREARRGWWAPWADSARVFPLSGSGAGRRRRPETLRWPGQAGLNPTPSAPTPCLRPVRRAPGSGPGPWRSAGAAARARERRILNGKRGLFLCLSAARAPATSGLPRALAGWGLPGPRALGAEDREGIPQYGLTTVGGLAPGATQLFAQVCVPWKKRLSLQSTKAKRPSRALKSPGLGTGAARGSGARWRGRAPGREGRLARDDERSAGGRRTAATSALAKKFCSQSEEEKLLLSLRQV